MIIPATIGIFLAVSPIAFETQITDAEFVFGTRARLDEIATYHRLSPDDMRLARHTAGVWVFVGPCQGDTKKLRPGDATSAISFVIGGTPQFPLRSAIAEMILTMTAPTLGRNPGVAACELALSLANPEIR